MKILWIFLLLLIILLIIYGYFSGSCQIDKEYKCEKNFCLIKEFDASLNNKLHQDIQEMLKMSEIQKRVVVKMFVENIFNCAIPNKSGTTIATQNIVKFSPELISFYQNELCDQVRSEIGLKLYPTSLNMPTSCAILIYEKEDDWINWHYDYNYYNGRFFTVLIPITHNLTCTKFQFKDKKNKIVSLDLNKNAICFEGNYVYHKASKLCKNEKRVMLSCQYVTDNSMSLLNQYRIKLKDFAYIGKVL